MKIIVKGLSISLLCLIANGYTLPVQAAVCGIVSTGGNTPLNIRHKASNSAGVIFRARPGSALTVLDNSSSWYQVQLNNGWIGYASGKYINNSGACGLVMTKNVPLAVRADMGSSSKVIGWATPGSALRLLENYDSVYKVKLDGGQVGYANRHSIKPEQSPDHFGTHQSNRPPLVNSSTGSPPSGKCGLVVTKASHLTIRKTPERQGDVISQASKESAVLILEKVDSWYKVKLNDGKVGYGSRDYIKTKAELGGYVFCGIVMTKSSPLNIRAGSDTKTKIVALADKGTALVVLNAEGNWYQVKLNDGTLGYGSRKYIRYSGGR